MARRGIELEVKFAPAGEGTLDALAARTAFPGWRICGRQDEVQHNTYFDTPNGTLEAASCSLRRRILDDGAGGVEWTFKRGRGPGRDGVARRREINVRLSGKVNGNKGDFPKVKCAPIERARRLAGNQPLVPLFTLLTIRHQIELVRSDGARVALALDRLQLEDAPVYRETEIEIELFDGDEGAVADLALWLMRTYGVLPMRGSKRGRALAWKRGLGLPVVGPALALEILGDQAVQAGDGAVIALASPRGSEQANRLAEGLTERLRITQADLPTTGPRIVVNRVLGSEDAVVFSAWVKVGLPRPLIHYLVTDLAAASVDPWLILRRLGEYVVPSQRRYLDPAARTTDLIVIDNAPLLAADQHHTPAVQMKYFGWPREEVLLASGATLFSAATEDDYFYRPPAALSDDYLRVRLREDTAWVSYADTTADSAITTHEARPRVLPLLRNLGYREQGKVRKERRRYRHGGWEIALDRVAQLGYFCEIRQVAADQRGLATIAATLGLDTLTQTATPYWLLVQDAQRAFPILPLH